MGPPLVTFLNCYVSIFVLTCCFRSSTKYANSQQAFPPIPLSAIFLRNSVVLCQIFIGNQGRI